MIIGSLSLMGYSPGDIGEIRAPADRLVGPYWLITTYFTLTIAELFLSPMALSFIPKVSPPQSKGMMQGGWLAATAIATPSRRFETALPRVPTGSRETQG